jgi:hypothetical protein
MKSLDMVSMTDYRTLLSVLLADRGDILIASGLAVIGVIFQLSLGFGVS